MAGAMGGLGGMLALMGGGGGLQLPAFPCALCTLAARTMRRDYPVQTTTTVVLGTPVCAAHVATLLDALGVSENAVLNAAELVPYRSDEP